MPEKRVYIRTFGCQMNEHDSQKMRLLLETQGYLPVDDPAEADLLLYNTCTIREKARHKALSEIGRAPGYKQARPGTIVGLCGCVAQQDGTALFERYPGIDFLFGPDQLSCLPELIEKAKEGVKTAALELKNDPSAYEFLDLIPPVTSHESRVTAFVAVTKGCNCACSYCIVPSVRGREISRPADAIVEEVVRLADAGAVEVTLLGQNVSAYGGGRSGLAGLIRRIAEETAIARIRFTSPHPRWIGPELVREYADNPKLCPHIHLPAQAGSDKVLRRMRRGYTRADYLDICARLRDARPGISITTDLIVGFCGETAEDFEATLEFMLLAGFDQAFAFKYSPRPGTEAAEKLADDLPAAEKVERLGRLLAQQRAFSRRRNEALVGTRGEALATGLDAMGRGLVTGRLADNRIVHFAGHAGCIGTIVPVAIVAAHDNSLAAEIVS